MFEFDGKTYKKMALYGGGCPMIGHYIGLFDETNMFGDLPSLRIPMITSSAGSVAVMLCLFKRLDATFETDSFHGIFEFLWEEALNVLDNLDKGSIIGNEAIERWVKRLDKPELYNLTFGDLKAMSPGFEWTVCCSEHGTFDLKTFGTHTEDVVVWRACLASGSLPVVFEGVEIHGSLNCDGDFTDWVGGLGLQDDVDCLHITSSRDPDHQMTFDTGVPLFDEALRFVLRCHLRLTMKTAPRGGVTRCDFAGNVHRHFLSREYVASGEAMAEKFVLKS